MKPKRLAVAHFSGMMVFPFILFFLTQVFDARGMTPTNLAVALVFPAAMIAYFYLTTTMIRFVPVGAGESIRTDRVTEMNELDERMRKEMKNFDALSREKSKDWQCSECGEFNGISFETCWNCSNEPNTA